MMSNAAKNFTTSLNFQENYFEDPTNALNLYPAKCLIVQQNRSYFRVETNSFLTAKTARTIRFSEAVPGEDGKSEDEHVRWRAQILFSVSKQIYARGDKRQSKHLRNLRRRRLCKPPPPPSCNTSLLPPRVIPEPVRANLNPTASKLA
ncbi:hypothetical protein ALC60_11902 [Trachymyrmex zeteki]|uniref:Uncharacterized protein n=1 Tax=Mycetomoellerius zeteki TaxID=64791 RepID=A0A151WM04_9HYME|nr:hypothetical protein ALC60_11902 [Trachymyrmex zeteki]